MVGKRHEFGKARGASSFSGHDPESVFPDTGCIQQPAAAGSAHRVAEVAGVGALAGDPGQLAGLLVVVGNQRVDQ